MVIASILYLMVTSNERGDHPKPSLSSVGFSVLGIRTSGDFIDSFDVSSTSPKVFKLDRMANIIANKHRLITSTQGSSITFKIDVAGQLSNSQQIYDFGAWAPYQRIVGQALLPGGNVSTFIFDVKTQSLRQECRRFGGRLFFESEQVSLSKVPTKLLNDEESYPHKAIYSKTYGGILLNLPTSLSDTSLAARASVFLYKDKSGVAVKIHDQWLLDVLDDGSILLAEKKDGDPFKLLLNGKRIAESLTIPCGAFVAEDKIIFCGHVENFGEGTFSYDIKGGAVSKISDRGYVDLIRVLP